MFRRNGADIHSDLLISIAQAVLGGTARCQGLYETINITVSTIMWKSLGINECGTAETSPLLQKWWKSKSASVEFQTSSGLSHQVVCDLPGHPPFLLLCRDREGKGWVDCWTNPIKGLQTMRDSLLVPPKAFLSLSIWLLNVSRCMNMTRSLPSYFAACWRSS